MNKEDIVPGKDSEISRCSTTAVSAISNTTSVSGRVRTIRTTAGSRQGLFFRLAIQGLIFAAAFGTLVIMIVPFPILLVLAIVTASFLHLIYIIYLLFYDKVEEIIQGNGFGQYIPYSLYYFLTETTMHEVMTDTTFFEEYRYLVLYFIPGITDEQLNSYVDNLSPRHRYQLRRHGLGHFAGERFMQLLMGESIYRNEVSLIQSQSNNDLLTRPPIPRDLSPVIEVDFNSINLESSASVQSTEREVQAGEALGEQPSSITIPINTRQDLDQEINVVSNAINDSTNYFMNMSIAVVSSGIGQLTNVIAHSSINAGLAFSTISTGVGLFGLWHNISFIGRRIPPRIGQISIPTSSQSFLSIAVLGGFSTGLLMFLRSYYFPKYKIKEKEKSEKDEKES